jgi:hypothetical protein
MHLDQGVSRFHRNAPARPELRHLECHAARAQSHPLLKAARRRPIAFEAHFRGGSDAQRRLARQAQLRALPRARHEQRVPTQLQPAARYGIECAIVAQVRAAVDQLHAVVAVRPQY